MGLSFILERYISMWMQQFIQGNTDFETPTAVRILLTRFLLTYFQARTILSFKRWLLLDETLLLDKPIAKFLCWVPGTISIIGVGTGLSGRLTSCRCPTASYWMTTSPGSTSTSVAPPLKQFYQQTPSTTQLSLHLHRQENSTMLTTNLVQDSGWYAQKEDISVQPSLLWAEV